jgi:large conductance mechanosensitive channel
MGKIKQFFTDFRDFISKGNILDLAVGVVIGAAFKEIINALVNNILMPVITLAVPGGLAGLVTVLNHSEAVLCAASNEAAVAAIPASTTTVTYWGFVYDASTVNVINWGLFINAVINFIIIAFIMFCIVRAAMKFSTYREHELKVAKAYSADEYKALRKQGHSVREIRKMSEDKVAADQKAADEKAKAEADAKAKEETEVQVLQEIKELLAKQEK